jgi:hypothetical protein
LVERIKAGVGLRDPKAVELAVRVGLDLTALQARAAAGEDVERELGITRASALNLSEHARNVIGREVLAFVQAVMAGALV